MRLGRCSVPGVTVAGVLVVVFELLLLFGASTGFFSSGISTRFTVLRGSAVAGLAAAGAAVVVTGVAVAVAAGVASPLVVSVASPSAAASAAASASATSFSSSSSVDAT